MISNLTFKQDNTVTDEPVVDLLKFLTDKLDAAVVKARLPTGRNPLQQLVLIISDGRLTEKVPDYKFSCIFLVIFICLTSLILIFKFSIFQEKLKQCIRDVSAGNRMVVFLVLDASKESIMDFQVSFSMLK